MFEILKLALATLRFQAGPEDYPKGSSFMGMMVALNLISGWLILAILQKLTGATAVASVVGTILLVIWTTFLCKVYQVPERRNATASCLLLCVVIFNFLTLPFSYATKDLAAQLEAGESAQAVMETMSPNVSMLGLLTFMLMIWLIVLFVRSYKSALGRNGVSCFMFSLSYFLTSAYLTQSLLGSFSS